MEQKTHQIYSIRETLNITKTPQTYQEAISSPDASKWRESMQREIDAHTHNGTWDEVPRKDTQDNRILTGKWVYKIKPNGQFKSRWVIRGFEQQLDPWEMTRAAVVQGTTTKILLTLAAIYGWKFHTADVKNAFLNGRHQGRPIYIQFPPGFGKPGTVCRINKSIYGLKTSAIIWYLDFRNKLEKMGFKVSKHDECLFIRDRTYVTVHVDDLGIYNDENDEVIKQLSQFFTLNPTNQERYLGMEITRTKPHAIRISQTTYTQSILDEFSNIIRTSNTPISMRAKTHTGKATPDEITLFQRIIGKLMYLACNTRPDITYAVIHASSFAQNPSPSAWEAIRDTLGYLSHTAQYGITLQGDKDASLQLTQYSDASFATGSQGRSVSGRITLLNGSPILWQSHQQTSVATSTMHSEYIAAYEAAIQAIPIHQLLREITPHARVETPKICIDNTAALTASDNGILTRQNRHFLVKYYWLHEQVSQGAITPEWVTSDQQLADILTKPPTKDKLQYFVQTARLGN